MSLKQLRSIDPVATGTEVGGLILLYVVSPCPFALSNDPREWVGFVVGDTASTCNSPPLDGLIIYNHADSTCGLSGRTYHVALPAAEVVASTSDGLCLSRSSTTTQSQQLFHKLPANIMGVRACCQQNDAFLYFYTDQHCREYGVPPEAPETEPRLGLHFSVNNGMVHAEFVLICASLICPRLRDSSANCEAKRISADFSELWVSAECPSRFGATCPPLEDNSPPTMTCPNLSDLEISVDYVARLRRDNLVDAFIEVTTLIVAIQRLPRHLEAFTIVFCLITTSVVSCGCWTGLASAGCQ